MKTMYFKLILALLIPFLTVANNDLDGRYTKQKKITKKYEVSANALLKVDNSYGNVDVTTWNHNRVEIEVIIITNGNDEESVQKRLDEIDVKFSHSSSEVSAKTLFEKENTSWINKLFSGGSDVNMEINYRIKAPVTNRVNLSNDYGQISLDKLEGDAVINCDYGKLTIGELRGNNNLLTFDYTRNSHIGYVKNAKINADYSDYIIEEAGTLDVSADYTKSQIEKVENLKFNCDYGSLTLGKARNVIGNGDYLTTKIAQVYNTLDLNLDYGGATIDQLMKGVKKVKINSDFSGLKIGYEPSNPFSFKINTSFGNVKGVDGKDFNLQKRHQDNTSNYYQGYYLADNSGATIEINSSYGSITFFD